MRIEQLMSKLFGYSAQTYFNWKKEQRLILDLLTKYISKEELEEFLETGTIARLDALDGLSIEDVYLLKDLKEVLNRRGNQ